MRLVGGIVQSDHPPTRIGKLEALTEHSPSRVTAVGRRMDATLMQLTKAA
jgi:hypothetical protein